MDRAAIAAGPDEGRAVAGASSVAGEATPSRLYVGYVVGILFTVNLFNYMDRVIVAVLSPLIKTDLDLSDTQIGLLVGLAFFVSYAVCAIPIARLADRGVRRSIIAACVLVWSAATALCGATQNFFQLLAARMGVAVGESGSFPASSSLLCDYVPLARRPAAFAVLSLGTKSGLTLGMALAGWLGQQLGWRAAFLTIGGAGLVFAILVRLTLREPPRGRFDPSTDNIQRHSVLETFKLLWARKTYRLLMLFNIFIGFAQSGLLQWWPSYYTRNSELGLAAVGLSLGTAIGVGSAIGLLAGGYLANKMAERDVRLPLLLGAGAILLAAPIAAASLWVSSPAGSITLVALVTLLWNVPTGAAMSSVYSVVPPHMRAMGGAVIVFVMAVLGYGLAPFCVGYLSDLLTPSLGPVALRYALLIPMAAIPIAAVALAAAARTLTKELRVQ